VILQQVASVEQVLTGLVPGKIYTVSWSQHKRIDNGAANDIHVSLGGTIVYSQDSVSLEEWVFKTSSEFIATSDAAVLKFWTTNPDGGSENSVLIDAISITPVAQTIDGMTSFLTRRL
jgi:hypothetical protein